LHAGGGDDHIEQQPGGVHRDVPLAPLTFLAASQPRVALGTVSAARTDWESMTAAVGWASRPAAPRTAAHSWPCSRAKVPSSRQAAK
jgi:hypothetical protein